MHTLYYHPKTTQKRTRSDNVELRIEACETRKPYDKAHYMNTLIIIWKKYRFQCNSNVGRYGCNVPVTVILIWTPDGVGPRIRTTTHSYPLCHKAAGRWPDDKMNKSTNSNILAFIRSLSKLFPLVQTSARFYNYMCIKTIILYSAGLTTYLDFMNNSWIYTFLPVQQIILDSIAVQYQCCSWG